MAPAPVVLHAPRLQPAQIRVESAKAVPDRVFGAFQQVWSGCRGIAPREDGCSFSTRFRGPVNKLPPVAGVSLDPLPAKDDPWWLLPAPCLGSACPTMATNLTGAFSISVTGRTRGFTRLWAEFRDGVMVDSAYEFDESWSPWEVLDVVVRVDGLDGEIPRGHWEGLVGIPVPSK